MTWILIANSILRDWMTVYLTLPKITSIKEYHEVQYYECNIV